MANVVQSQGPKKEIINITRPTGVENFETSVEFCDTPIVYGFSSKKFASNASFYDTVLAPVSVLAPVGTDVVVGDTLTINGIVLTASNNPQNSREFLAGTGTQSKYIAESLANCINTDVNLAPIANARTFIFLGYWVVRITSKNAGSNFNLTITANFVNNSNVVLSPVVAQDASRGQSLQKYRYKIFVDVYAIPETDMLSLPTVISLDENEKFLVRLEKNWTTNNISRFDIANILKSQIKFFTPAPWEEGHGGLVYNTFTKTPKQSVGYRLKYGESFIGGIDINTGDPVDSPDNIQNFYQQNIVIGDTSLSYATHGAFSLNNNMPCTTNFWQDDRIDALTSIPNKIRRSRQAQTPWFFTSILWKAEVDETYEFIIQYSHTLVDGTKLPTEITPILQHFENGIYTISLSDENLNLPSEKLLFTTFRIRGTNAEGGYRDISKDYKISWDLNPDYKDKERIYFRNKFGQIEQFDFDLIEEVVETDTETFQFGTSLEPGNTRNRGDVSNLEVESKTEITLAASNLDEDNYNYLKEFVNSLDHYRISKAETGFTDIGEEGLNVYPSGQTGTFEGFSLEHSILGSPACSDMSQAITVGLETNFSYQGSRCMEVSSRCETEDDWSGIEIVSDNTVTLEPNTIYTLEGYGFVPENAIRGFGYDSNISWKLDGLTDTTIIEQKSFDINFGPKGQWVRFYVTFQTNSDTNLTPTLDFPSILGTENGDALYFDSFSIKTAAGCVVDQQEGFEKYLLTSQNWTKDKENDLYSLEITLESSIKNNTISR